ncbi:MAG: hypothetical protein QOG48_1068 [Verrucomicrobiota bacterium]|jgi:hypothetical protein
MQRDDDKQLWDLLGQAKTPPAASPFFARNIVREIRQEPRWKAIARAWLAPRRLIPATAFAAALIAGLMIFERPTTQEDIGADSDPIAQIDPQDYEVVADLDNLLAAEDNNLWDDDNDNSTL